MKKRISLLLAALLVAMTLIPAYAASFTPSVTGKDAPDVMQAEKLYDDGTVKEDITREVKVVPVSKRDDPAVHQDVRQALTAAYSDVKNAGTLDKLTTDINDALAAHPGVKLTDLVVSDLFDVTYMVGGVPTDLTEPARVRFHLTVPVDDLIFVLHKYDDTHWEVINLKSFSQQDCVTLIDRNTLEVVFTNGFSPVAFVIDGGRPVVNPGGPTSPQTGEPSPLWVILAMTAAAACAACAVVRREKKSAHK